jgi:hypothetical protein
MLVDGNVVKFDEQNRAILVGVLVEWDYIQYGVCLFTRPTNPSPSPSEK